MVQNNGMYIHVFAFRWKPGVTDGDKERATAGIRALQGQIPGLLETYVGSNVSDRGQDYAFAGVMKFASKLALDNYPDHPTHQALLTWLIPMVEALELDFAAE